MSVKIHAKNLLFLFIASLISCSSTANETYNLTIEEVKDDLRQLHSELQRYHAGYDWYSSKESLDIAFENAIDGARTSNIIALFRQVRKLVAQVHCGHTRASLPETTRLDFEAKTQFLPLSVEFIEDRLYLKATVESADLSVGDEVISVNSKPVAEIKSTLYQYLSSDGYNETLKDELTNRNFSYGYSLFIDDKASDYELQVAASGTSKEITVAGTSIRKLLEINQTEQSELPLTFTSLEAYDYLKISTFGSGRINRSGQNYYEFLDETFEKLNGSSKPLILDLRGNGGGDDMYGATLVSYLLDHPFRYFEKIEVTDDYSGYGNIVPNGDSRLMTSHDGLSVQQPQQNRFDGDLYVLIDGRSFSTCADVASVLKANKRGIFIGQETGGGAGGNTSGYSTTITLDHSGITVNLPMWKYTTAPDPNHTFGRGVIPDFTIQKEIADLLSDADLELTQALELIREN